MQHQYGSCNACLPEDDPEDSPWNSVRVSRRWAVETGGMIRRVGLERALGSSESSGRWSDMSRACTQERRGSGVARRHPVAFESVATRNGCVSDSMLMRDLTADPSRPGSEKEDSIRLLGN